jgi:DNA-binding CsgD family transcriptional regulator
MARALGDPAAEALALVTLGIAAGYRGDNDAMVALIHRQQQIPESIPAHSRAGSTVLVGALIVSGDPAVAESTCAAALAQSRDAGDLPRLASLLNMMAYLYVRTGRFAEAAAYLREGLQLVMRTGDLFEMTNCLWTGTLLCAATGLPAEAVTLWAARDGHDREHGVAVFAGRPPEDSRVEQQMLTAVRDALGPDRAQAAEQRGAAMNLDMAAEYALLLTAPAPQVPAAEPGLSTLTVRERELVTLVARGWTNAQIAAQLFISVRTVGSHLDRIRDKTGCRRRADLTRLALAEGLV